MTAVSRWRRSLARSRSAASAWSVTSVAKISTPPPCPSGDSSTGVQVKVYERPVAALRDLTVRGLGAAQDLVEEGQQAQLVEFGQCFARGRAGGRAPNAAA